MKSRVSFEIRMFLIPCMAVTGLLMLLAGGIGREAGNPASTFLAEIACLVPGLTAAILCLVTGEDPERTGILPGFRKNAGWYVLAVLLAMALSLPGEPVTAILFPEAVRFDSFDLPEFVLGVLAVTGFSLPSVILMLGEELGWLGYLFPRLEKKYGTLTAVIAMALARGVWHLILFAASGGEDVLRQFLMVTLYNLLLDSVLVYVTKRSGSIVPATLLHTLTNGLSEAYAPFVTVDAAAYQRRENAIWLANGMPAIVLGVVCYLLIAQTYRPARRPPSSPPERAL